MTGSLRAIVLKLVVFTAFTLAVTGLLAAVIGNVEPFSDFYDVTVEFTDATGLMRNDTVKIAGVDVGKVTGARVSREPDRPLAEVKIQVGKDVTLPGDTRAAIRFRNLLGQRMVVLSAGPGERSDPISKRGGGRIPVSQTSPAFDLSVVFNNLRPVLQSLDPDDANTVSRALVRIFSGREAQTQQMIADLADLAHVLGERGPVAADLVRDLDTVVTRLARRDEELRSILGSFDQVMATLAGRSPELGRTIANVGEMADATASLIADNRPGLDAAISQLRDILSVAAAHKQDLDAALKALPGATHALSRATTYGEWANLIGVCMDSTNCPQAQATASQAAVADLFGLAAGVRR